MRAYLFIDAEDHFTRTSAVIRDVYEDEQAPQILANAKFLSTHIDCVPIPTSSATNAGRDLEALVRVKACRV